MTGPSRAIRRQAEKAHKTALKLIQRGIGILEKHIDPEACMVPPESRAKISVAIADIETAFEIEDAGIRAHGLLIFSPEYRKQAEAVVTQAKDLIETATPEAWRAGYDAERARRGLTDPINIPSPIL